VINLSSKELSPAQQSILSKGLNFAPAPRKVPIPQIVASVESGLRYVPVDTAAEIRQKVIALLKKIKPP
jgi:hypothetical protein